MASTTSDVSPLEQNAGNTGNAFFDGNTDIVTSSVDSPINITKTDYKAIELGINALDKAVSVSGKMNDSLENIAKRNADTAENALDTAKKMSAENAENMRKASESAFALAESLNADNLDFARRANEESISAIKDVNSESLDFASDVNSDSLDFAEDFADRGFDSFDNLSEYAFDFGENVQSEATKAVVDMVELNYDGMEVYAEKINENNKLAFESVDQATKNANDTVASAIKTVENSTRSDSALALGDISKNMMFSAVAVAGMFILSKWGKSA